MLLTLSGYAFAADLHGHDQKAEVHGGSRKVEASVRARHIRQRRWREMIISRDRVTLLDAQGRPLSCARLRDREGGKLSQCKESAQIARAP